MKQNTPNKLLIEAEVAASPLVQTICKQLPQAATKIVDRIPDGNPYDPQLLELVSFKGRFLKNCPGTRHYHCCGYQILHFGMQCSLNCTYCILQAYLNEPNLRLFANTDALFEELEAHLNSSPGELHRIGTGEFTDSLLLDPWSRFSRQLVPYFAKRDNAILELKTKTTFIDNLEDLPHEGHTIAAWSLNAETVWRHEEARAPSIVQRLKAARRCADWGYWLAFHFDPMIDYPGWQKDYAETLDRLFEAIDPSHIVWISLGAFRFMPDLKRVLVDRHPRSRIPYGEFIRGLDGKLRYFRAIRVELYRFMAERIRSVDPNLCTYLCMEGEDIWREALGFSPEEKGGVPALLDQAAKDRMKVARHCRSRTLASGTPSGPVIMLPPQ